MVGDWCLVWIIRPKHCVFFVRLSIAYPVTTVWYTWQWKPCPQSEWIVSISFPFPCCILHVCITLNTFSFSVARKLGTTGTVLQNLGKERDDEQQATWKKPSHWVCYECFIWSYQAGDFSVLFWDTSESCGGINTLNNRQGTKRASFWRLKMATSTV